MRNSDLLLDDFDKEQQSYANEQRKKRCSNAGVAVVAVPILILLGVFAFFALPAFQNKYVSSSASEPSSPFLRAPHLCDTCPMNPEVDDYILCSSCGFEPSNDKTLKCPKGYGNMFITKAHVGVEQSALVEGKIYSHCKEQMADGSSSCNLNVAELVPELDLAPPPRPEPRDRKDWMRKKGMDFDMPPSPFGFAARDILPFDELPTGPNGEKLIDDALEEDQAILEALDQEPEIASMEKLFLSIPHQPSLRLQKALMRCMEPGNKQNKASPLCADGQEPLKCHGADAQNDLCVNRVGHTPVCVDGSTAACPDGMESFKKHSHCFPENGDGVPVRPTCADGEEAKRCRRKAGGFKPECMNKKGKKKNIKVFCKDGSKPSCPAGYVDKKKAPKCRADNGVDPNVSVICEDGQEPVFCRENGVVNDLCKQPDGKRIHKKKICVDGSKPQCPIGYSKGPCIADVADENEERERTGFVCEDPSDELIHCHKRRMRNKNPSVCGQEKKAKCVNSQTSATTLATCPVGFTLEKAKPLFLSAPKPHRGQIFTGEEAYLLPHGPHGESLLGHATAEDQPILDALMEVSSIEDVDELFEAIPDEHPLSFKLGKAMIKCMNPDDITDIAELECASGEILKECKKVQPGEPNYDACQKKLEYKALGKKTPFCSDMTFAKCPDGYVSYTKHKPCISQDGLEKKSMVCADGAKALDCKSHKNKGTVICGDKKGKRFRCVDNSKPQCPANTSKGECKNATGDRTKAKCSFEEGVKEKVVKCFKKSEQSNPLCENASGFICQSTGAAPTCPDGFDFDFSAYRKDLDTVPAALVLNAPRPQRPPHPHGPPRGPHGKPLKGVVSVDYLCLKVDLN